MAVKIAEDLAIAIADFVASQFAEGANAAQLIIYDGTEPADLETATTTQNELVVFDLPDPEFGSAAATATGGTITLEAVTPVNASATGTASWFRISNRDDEPLTQGSVSDTAGSGDLKVSSTSVVSGIEVSVVSLTITFRKA